MAAMTRREFIEMSATAIGASAASRAQLAPRLPQLTIAAAAQQIRTRRLSPVELTEAVLQRIAALDAKVGAFVTVAGDQARSAAREAEREVQRGRYRGPLHGIPFAVKDTYYTKGIRTTAGSRILEHFIPDADSTCVERLKTAGAVLVGKTNLPEFSFGGYTPGCNNPWDLARNAGGSSGGSAAALAASMVLGTCGGDTSGSIRNPASACGVVGFKPTFGVVSRHRVVPISWTLDHLGPMANTVEDAAIVLDVIAGYDPQDRYSVQAPPANYRRALTRAVRGLRVGIIAPAQIDQFHADTKAAFFAAANVFEQLGGQIREITFPPSMRVGDAIQRVIRIAEAATYHRRFLVGRQADRYYREGDRPGPAGPSVRTSVEAGSLLTAADYLEAQRARSVFLDHMKTMYEPIDVLLTPTMPSPAGVASNARETFRTWWNLTGYPAISIPCGFSRTPSGLPIGLQISAKPFQDALVLAAAHAYERATPWHARKPSL